MGVVKNLFDQIPASLPEELVEIIGSGKGTRIERIVSRGHTSPPLEAVGGEQSRWYDQPLDEFVLLLSGGARLGYANGDEVTLQPGDALLIPAHVRHRVVWTMAGVDTVWLAVHFQCLDVDLEAMI